MENKYHNSKIYAVKNTINDEVYIGSTTVALSKRMVKHRFQAKQEPEKACFAKVMSELGIENFYIELIEKVKCEDIEELRKHEGEYIKEMGTLNQRVAGSRRAQQLKEQYEKAKANIDKEKIREYKRQWCEKNQERLIEQRKQHHQDNKEELITKHKEYYENNKEELLKKNKKYYQNHKDELKQKSNDHYHKNKDKFSEHNKQIIKCPCGVKLSQANKTRHLKSKFHINYEKSLSETND